MAYYEFECTECGYHFTVQQTFEQHDQHREVKCPECGSPRVEHLLTAAYAQTSKKS